MSKRRNNNSLSTATRGRDLYTPIQNRTLIARRSLPRVSNYNYDALRRLQTLQADNRLFHPLPRRNRPVFTIYGQTAVIQNRLQQKGRSVYATQAFRLPRTVSTCVRRRIRKEVIFASGKSGRGGHRRYRRTPQSSVSC